MVILVTHEPGIAVHVERVIQLRDGKIGVDERSIALEPALAPAAVGVTTR